jgi:MFS transporter, DHA1 family, multidrug resistance protein
MLQKRHLYGLFPWFLILYEFAVNLSNDMYVPSLTQIATEFGVTDNIINLTMTAWFVGAALPLLWVGPLSDRIGRRPVLFTGGVLFLLSTLICATSTDFWTLFVGRLFQGISVSTLLVAGYSCVHDAYDDEHAVHILAWLGAATILAPMLGPTAGAFLLLVIPWQILFWIILIIAAAGLIGLWPAMPETVVPIRKHDQIRSIYRLIFHNRPFLFTGLTLGCGYAGLVAWVSGSLFLLVDDLQLSPQIYGLVQIPVFCSYFLGAKVIKKLLGPYVRRHCIPIGLTIALLASATQLGFSFANLFTLPTLIIPISIYAFGFAMAAAPLTRAAIATSTQPRGALTAAFFLYLMTLSALGSLSVTLIYNHTTLSIVEVIAAFIALSFLFNLFRKSPILI